MQITVLSYTIVSPYQLAGSVFLVDVNEYDIALIFSSCFGFGLSVVTGRLLLAHARETTGHRAQSAMPTIKYG